MRRFLALLAILIAVLLLVSFIGSFDCTTPIGATRVFYVGVTFCLNTTSEARLLIDKVKSYTNLFIVDSGPVSKNETVLNEICEYAIDSGLNIIVYFGILDCDWQLHWIETAKQRWGNQFLGVYFFDEPGGSVLDYAFPSGKNLDSQYEAFLSNPPENYEEMANHFESCWQTMPELQTIKTVPGSPIAFTSDYALYWFGYLAGYDVILAQFGWNHTRNQDIALVRGAAKVQDKSWGVIITWTFDKPPYLETGDKLFDDMLMAYKNGAKYVAVFNYPKINEYGILEEGHFSALERFWHEIQDQTHAVYNAESVLILPSNYGWGMRNPNDTIWGLWGPDENSPRIWNVTRTLLNRYSPNIDIVYEDARFPVEDKYDTIYYWKDMFQ